MSKIFLDANIVLDLIDEDRGSVAQTKSEIAKYIKNGDELFTSCDIFTTVYYVSTKKIAKATIIEELERLLVFVAVLPIDMTTVRHALEIAKNTTNSDLEDVLQYVCALQQGCDLILSNDSSFYTDKIKLKKTTL